MIAYKYIYHLQKKGKKKKGTVYKMTSEYSLTGLFQFGHIMFR